MHTPWVSVWLTVTSRANITTILAVSSGGHIRVRPNRFVTTPMIVINPVVSGTIVVNPRAHDPGARHSPHNSIVPILEKVLALTHARITGPAPSFHHALPSLTFALARSQH